MQYRLTDIQAEDWNEALDTYLTAKAQNKKVDWHGWYLEEVARNKRSQDVEDFLNKAKEKGQLEKEWESR
jgi:hypothetical protein